MLFITVYNWDEYNSRADVKNPSWLRLQVDFFVNPKFFGLNSDSRVIYLYLLSRCCIKQTKQIEVNPMFFTQMLLIPMEKAIDSLSQLNDIGVIEVNEDSHVRGSKVTLRPRTLHTDIQTYRHTDIHTVRKKNEEVAPTQSSGASSKTFEFLSEEINAWLGEIPGTMRDRWVNTYKKSTLLNVITSAHEWEITQPKSKRKKNIPMFVNNWIKRDVECEKERLDNKLLRIAGIR